MGEQAIDLLAQLAVSAECSQPWKAVIAEPLAMPASPQAREQRLHCRPDSMGFWPPQFLLDFEDPILTKENH
jgi:hypothetical protein